MNIEITINEYTFAAELYDNETAWSFKTLLPITLNMSELNSNKKYYYLSDSLPTAPHRPAEINKGDIML